MVKISEVKKNLNLSKQVENYQVVRTTITKSLTKFQIYLMIRGNAKRTRENYNKDVIQFKTFLKEGLNNKVEYVDQIREEHIKEYEDYISRENFKKKYKTNTIKRKLNSLKRYFEFINQVYGISITIDTQTIFKDLKNDAKAIDDNYFSEIEIDILFNYLESRQDYEAYRDRAMIYFLYYTGCRRSEMLQIKWSELDLIKNKVWIKQSKADSHHIVVLHEDVINKIVRYAEMFGYESEYVFPKSANKGEPFKGSTFYSRFKKILRDAGGIRESLSPHSMRHTFIARCKENGISDDVIIDYTRHRNVQGLKPYSHLGFDYKEKVFEALEIDKIA